MTINNCEEVYMRKLTVSLLVVLLVLLGCVAPMPALTVNLASPGNGSSVPSSSPVLAWDSTGGVTSYRLQVASDSNFQNLAIDVSELTSPVYTVPAGKLNDDTTYYWRVIGSRSGVLSSWSPSWSFRTAGAPTPGPTPSPASGGDIQVSVTLDGSPWSGSVNYVINGPFSDTEDSVPKTFRNVSPGNYTITYNYGGPTGASLASITPTPTQVLVAGNTINFILNFHRQLTSSIIVNATLDGSPWSGVANISLTGPFNDSHSNVPCTFPNLPPGNYALIYNYGGPAGAALGSITPSPTQALGSGGTLVFTLNFFTQQRSGTVIVNATLDRKPWKVMPGSGPISYTVTGTKTDSGDRVPETFSNMPAGPYTLNFNNGGPIGATLTNITPAPSQNLAPGGTVAFTMNFSGQPKGTVMISATLNGSPWSGEISYVLQGPYVDSGHAVPATVSNAPSGTYRLQYNSGGPPGGVFEGVSPSTQVLPAGGTISFNIKFKFKGVLPEPKPEPMPGPLK